MSHRHGLNDALYNSADLKEFALREYVRTENLKNQSGEVLGANGQPIILSRTSVPGFFTPYKSFADVQNQLKSPVAMPILCLAQVAQAGIIAIQDLLLAALNVATLDFKRVFSHGKNALGATVGAILYTVLAVVDTLFALVALATRTGATLVAGLTAGASAMKTAAISTGSAVKNFFVPASALAPTSASAHAAGSSDVADDELLPLPPGRSRAVL